MGDRRIAGLVLAAGAGTRFGGPKALAGDGAWLSRAVATLRAGGADPVVVVVGAEAAAALIPAGAVAVVAEDWAEGLSASLRAGLDAVQRIGDAAAVVVTLVDLPELPAAAVQRLLAPPLDSATLRQAVYRGRPGHPVVLGRDGWAGLRDDLRGDAGARQYLIGHGVQEIECADLWDGRDVDRP